MNISFPKRELRPDGKGRFLLETEFSKVFVACSDNLNDSQMKWMSS